MNQPSYKPAPSSVHLPHADEQSLIQVSDLSFSVAGRTLLEQIELDLTQGELLVVVGRNGAGKSTLLKNITGELSGRGSIQVFGESLNSHRPRELARRRAVLPQHTHLSFGYEVEEVVLLGRIPHQRRQVETDEDRVIAHECLRRVGLASYANRNYLTLSGGEQQRVHLARVLAQLSGTDGDRLLLLDEPTSSLDLAYQHQVLRLSRELCSEGVGVLAVLHDLNLASQYADKVAVLEGGRILAYGTPFSVLTPDTVRTAFGHEVMVVQHPCLNCPLIVSAT